MRLFYRWTRRYRAQCPERKTSVINRGGGLPNELGSIGVHTRRDVSANRLIPDRAHLGASMGVWHLVGTAKEPQYCWVVVNSPSGSCRARDRARQCGRQQDATLDRKDDVELDEKADDWH